MDINGILSELLAPQQGILSNPRDAALMQLGLGLLAQSGPQPRKVGLGEAFGKAGMPAMDTYRQGELDRQRRLLQALEIKRREDALAEQKRLHDAQIGSMETRDLMQMNKLRREMEQELRQSGALQNLQGILSLPTEEEARRQAIEADRRGEQVNIRAQTPEAIRRASLAYDPTGAQLGRIMPQARGQVVPAGGAYIPPGATTPSFQAEFRPTAPERPLQVQGPSGPIWQRPAEAIGEPAPSQRDRDLKPGERRTMDGRIEAIPGSAEYVRRSGLHAKDYQSLQAINIKTDNAMRKLEEILDEKNKDAFNSNFGGYNALATQYMPGGAQDMRASLDSLKSDLKNAGLEMMRAGGSIGQMTVQEWPIVERALENITPLLSEKVARERLNQVKAHLERIRANARDIYETEWRESQFFREGRAPTGDQAQPSRSRQDILREYGVTR